MQEVIDFESKRPKADENGQPLYTVKLVAMGEGDAEILPVKVPGAANLLPGTAVRVLGLTASPWTKGDRSWRPACEAAGLPGFKVRNLRHTGASLAIAAGADVEHLAGRLGHSSSSVTSKIYTEIFEGRDREIADRLERLAHDPETQRRLRG